MGSEPRETLHSVLDDTARKTTTGTFHEIDLPEQTQWTTRDPEAVTFLSNLPESAIDYVRKHHTGLTNPTGGGVQKFLISVVVSSDVPFVFEVGDTRVEAKADVEIRPSDYDTLWRNPDLPLEHTIKSDDGNADRGQTEDVKFEVDMRTPTESVLYSALLHLDQRDLKLNEPDCTILSIHASVLITQVGDLTVTV